MTNFDIFASISEFEPFASVAVSAERILHIDPSACVLNCRRAMEFAVKWMYSVDDALRLPYDDRLVSLMDSEDFQDIVGQDIWRRMKLIRQLGNHAAHSGRKSPRSRRRCVWKTSMYSWTSWPIAMVRTTQRGTLTVPC